MELSKDITLGQYVPRQSPVHRMDPRMKITLWLAIMVSLFFIDTFVGYGLMALFLGLVIYLAQIPVGYGLRGLKPAIPFMVVLFIIQLMFSGSLFADSPNVVFHWGFIRITTEALRTYTLVIIRVLLLFLSVTILTLATSLVSLTDGVESMMNVFRPLGVPANELAMVMVIALRFVPTLVDELERIMKAQMARGADIETGNFIQKTRQRIPVLIPLLLNSFNRAEELIVAMEARCYRGGKGRTKRKQLKLTALDWKAAAVCAGFLALLAVQIHYMGAPW